MHAFSRSGESPPLQLIRGVLPGAGKVQGWTKQGLQLQDGTELPADLVVQALGYDKPHAYLSAAISQRLQIGDDGLHLYRNSLAPRVPVRPGSAVCKCA